MNNAATPMPSLTSPNDSVIPFETDSERADHHLRLWPAIVILAIQWPVVLIPKWLAPGTMAQFMGMFWGPIVGGVAFSAWWLFASRLPRRERWALFGACVGLAAIAYAASHRSVGLMGLSLYGLPAVTTAWAGWLLISSRLDWKVRRAGLLTLFLLVWGYFCLLRLDGIDGSLNAELAFRWTPTAEQKFLDEISTGKATTPTAGSSATTPSAYVATPSDWPEFRGTQRTGRRTGTRLDTNWTAHPPEKIWGQRIGPGWSSFSVVGGRLYTQDQRGDDETVVCYDAATGAELWVHRDAARFTEVVAGAGPRATPTFHAGRLYTQGAAGRLNCLDAATGKPVWSHDLIADSGATLPQWGFSASPLVVGDLVVVFAGGPEGKGVLAYHHDSGKLVWSADSGQFSYCSLQKFEVAGVEQLLITTDAGLTAFNPVDGKRLWHHAWQLDKGMSRVVQPALVGDSDFLIGTSFGYGLRRVHVARDGEGWKTEEVWTTRKLKPYYNDLVVHKGFAYGFDGNIFACIDLANGEMKWRARGYGNGQALLLPDQDLLLILSETGEVTLLTANSSKHEELGRFEAIEGKTWNHPVLVNNLLYVRNGEKIACYKLPELGGAPVANATAQH